MLNHVMPRRVFLSGAALMLAAPNLAFAQTSPDALGRAVTELFDPIQGPAARARFTQTHLSPAGRQRWAEEAFQRNLDAIAAASGGFDFLSAQREERGGLRILARTRRQGLARTLLVFMDREDTTKVFRLLTLPMPAAYDRPGLSGPVSLAAMARAIDERVRYAVERDEFSGAVLISTPEGDVVYENAFGFADRERGVANTLDTRFHLGSSDKSFTALMIARLVAEGRLWYETTVAEVLPNYPNAEFAQACTMRHLITHSAGLGGLFERARWDQRQRFERMADIFTVFAHEPPHFAPGERSSYSNEGFIVLGAVIEAVTGRSWYDLLAEQIYAPAGMRRSAHLTSDATGDDIAIGYRYRDDDHLGLLGRVANHDFRGWRGNSCGGGYSTVRDMTAYLHSLRAGRLLSAAALEPMLNQPQPGLRNYGMGFTVSTFGARRVIGHGGGGPHSGIDGDHGIVWETGWAYSILGNYDAPFVQEIAGDIMRWLAAM